MKKTTKRKIFILTLITSILTSNFSYSAINEGIINSIKIVGEYTHDTSVEQVETVTFGSYPQNDANGATKEPIEWIVLEKDSVNHKALLLSKYVLDCQKYHDEDVNRITWETSSLRTWLNEVFYNNAFDTNEKTQILPRMKNIEFSKNGQTYNSLEDNVFLLRFNEVNESFPGLEFDAVGKLVGSDRRVVNTTKATKYAESLNGNYLLNKKVENQEQHLNEWVANNCSYWLRTDIESDSTSEKENGHISNIEGLPKLINFNEYNGVRPAIYVSYAGGVSVKNDNDIRSEHKQQQKKQQQEYIEKRKNKWTQGPGGGWTYSDEEGKQVINTWKQIDGKWYYFTRGGVLLQNNMTPDGFWVDENGEWKEGNTPPATYRPNKEVEAPVSNVPEGKNAGISRISKSNKKGLLFNGGNESDMEYIGCKQVAINHTLGRTDGFTKSMIKNFKDKNMKITIILTSSYDTYDGDFSSAPVEYQNPYFYMPDLQNATVKDEFDKYVNEVGEYVDNWVIGNEISDQSYNCYIPCLVEEYTKVYCWNFNIAYNVIKKKNKKANVYIPFDQSWDMPALNKNSSGYNPLLAKYKYNTKEMLSIINKQLGKNIDWGVAAHPYPDPVSSPVFWDDKYAGHTDEESAREPNKAMVVTMNNIEVLFNFLNQSSFRKNGGSKRNVLISEIGISGSEGDDLQATALAYAFYKIAENDQVKGFLYNGQSEFALSNAALNAYKYIDTGKSNDYLLRIEAIENGTFKVDEN